MSQPSSFNAYGAVDLGALAARSSALRPAPAGAGDRAAAGAGGGAVLDVSEATFEQEVIERSMTVPVVIDFWASWCEPCKQLTPVLEKLAGEYAGRFVLAKIDADAEQRLAAAFRVQSIPTVFAVLKGQPVPLFQGALPEEQVRGAIEQVLEVAAANGITGTAAAGPPAPAAPAEPPVDPRFDEAYDAIERGDYDAAAAAYRSVLAQSPADADARAGLAQVELLRRVDGTDPDAVLAAATDPADVDAQCAAADVLLLTGDVDGAFGRLVDAVRHTSGDDRERARARLLELFELVGDDPRVAKARLALANALF